FAALAEFGQSLGFTHVASGPMVRSSYHADLQAHNAGIKGTSINSECPPSQGREDIGQSP
ncbi:MAG: hypothetical protein ACREXR_21505, partial [Gammaproteobacteria bacterium]